MHPDWGKENRWLYRGLRYIEVRYIEVPLYLSGLSPSDSFDEALADMIHDGVNDLRNDLAKGHFEKDEAKKVRFFSLNSIRGVGGGILPLTAYTGRLHSKGVP